jgi:hypothetical protein
MNVNHFDDEGLRPIKEVMGRNLIDRSFRAGYGAVGSATVKYVVCERAWRRDYPRRASIGFSGAGNHRFPR